MGQSCLMVEEGSGVICPNRAQMDTWPMNWWITPAPDNKQVIIEDERQ